MFAAFKARGAAKPQAAAAPVGNVEPVAPGEFSEKWSAVLAGLKDQLPGVHGVLSQGRLLGVEDGCAVIEVNPQVESLIRSFEKNGKKEILRGKIAETFGPGVGVKFRIGEATEAPAAPARAAPPQGGGLRNAPQESAPAAPVAPPPPRLTPEQVDAAKQDPLVRAVLEQFGGTIVKVET